MKQKSRIRKFSFLVIGIALFLTNSCNKADDNRPVDWDGNVYNTVTIGTQVWMAENLKVTHYSNGDPILIGTDNTTWNSLTIGAYSDYDNSPDNSATYGRLYNFYAIDDSRKLCPAGWHVAGDGEIEALVTTIGGFSGAGGNLKEAGTARWHSPNTGATDSYGFKLLPAGYRNEFGIFDGLGFYSDLWSSTATDVSFAWRFLVLYNDIYADGNAFVPKQYGFSVRCIKD
jgi:uncharacterized protein (TIGR02145 family)